MKDLSPRELDVAVLLAGGHTKEEVAARLGLSPRTVKSHADNARLKLDIDSTRYFARRLVELGYVSADELIREAA
jgi:two-component system, NarL family, invasion response regulator UvrY